MNKFEYDLLIHRYEEKYRKAREKRTDSAVAFMVAMLIIFGLCISVVGIIVIFCCAAFEV